MIAKSQPIGVKLQPTTPKTDAERLQQLRETLQRHLAGAVRTNAEIAKLEAKLKEAA